VSVQKRKAITLPDDILANFIGPNEIAEFRASGTGIYSITVSGKKQAVMAAKEELKTACCGSGSNCC
jgi:hypothetical protein